MSMTMDVWPFLLCLIQVLFFVTGAILVLLKFEGPAKLKPSVEDGPIGDFDGSDLWVCCSRILHPGILCVFRAVAFFYLLFVMLSNLISHGFFVYLFYTQWTFTLLIVYFGLAMYISVIAIIRSKKNLKDMIDEETQSLRNETAKLPRGNQNLGYTIIVIFQVVTPAVLLTDLVYWLILVPFVLRRGHTTDFINMNMHAVNAVFLLGEFFLNSMPFPWFRGAYLVIWSAAYVIFQWTLHAFGFIKWWPYPFLEVSTPWAPLWYFGLAVAHLLCFLISLGLARAKRPFFAYLKNSWQI